MHIFVIVMSVIGCLIVVFVCVCASKEGAAGRTTGIQKEKGTEESAEDERAGTRAGGSEV